MKTTLVFTLPPPAPQWPECFPALFKGNVSRDIYIVQRLRQLVDRYQVTRIYNAEGDQEDVGETCQITLDQLKISYTYINDPITLTFNP